MDLKATTSKTELTRALAIAKVCASPDKTMPLLHALNFNVTQAGHLVVNGTDRYIAVRARLASDNFTYGDNLTEGKLTIGLQQVGLIQKWLTLVDKEAPVTLEWDAQNGLDVSAYAAPTLSGITTIEGLYPILKAFVRPDEAVDYTTNDRPGAATLGTQNLAKLGTIAGYSKRQTPVLLRPGTKEINSGNDLLFRFSDGDKITADGVVMGVRTNPQDPINQHGL